MLRLPIGSTSIILLSIMLNVSKFHALMSPQTLSQRSDYDELMTMIDETPWFADAQILRLKMLKEQGYASYAKSLPKLSLYATHREYLAEYMDKIDSPQFTINFAAME